MFREPRMVILGGCEEEVEDIFDEMELSGDRFISW